MVNLLLPYLATDDDEDDAAQLREASAMEGDGSDFTIYDRWNNLLEALTIAISIRDTDTAVVLIRAGADVAATNCFQQAIYKGDKEMVRFLLANGADKEAQLFLKDYAYVTPLIFAIEMENREIVQVSLTLQHTRTRTRGTTHADTVSFIRCCWMPEPTRTRAASTCPTARRRG